MPWFKTLKFKKSEAEKAEASGPSAETKPVQTVEPSAQQSTSQISPLPDELKELEPLRQNWQRALKEAAEIRIADTTLVKIGESIKPFYVLKRLPSELKGETTIHRLIALGEDLLIYLLTQKVTLDNFGLAVNVETEAEQVKPSDYSISAGEVADIVNRLIKGVS